MPLKLTETLCAFVVLTILAAILAFGFQSDGAKQVYKFVQGLFFEDLDDIASGPTPAEPLDQAVIWFTSDDYPAEALRNGWQGTSAIEWTIDRRGRPVNCKVVQSSGHFVLDEAACNAILSRARYKPARNAEGRRVEKTARRRVTWRLPD